MKTKNITIKMVSEEASWAWKLMEEHTNVIILMSECKSAACALPLFHGSDFIDLNLYINTNQ